MQILGANAGPPSSTSCAPTATTSTRVLIALDDPDAPGSRRAHRRGDRRRQRGRRAPPGQARAGPSRFSQLVVMVDDKPGELARLLDRDRRGRREHGRPAARALARARRSASPRSRCCPKCEQRTRRRARAAAAGRSPDDGRHVSAPSGPIVVAIDGPAGSGKSSVSKARGARARLRLPRHRRRVPRARLARASTRASTPTDAADVDRRRCRLRLHDRHRPRQLLRAGRLATTSPRPSGSPG